jgi:hypothetical protein
MPAWVRSFRSSAFAIADRTSFSIGPEARRALPCSSVSASAQSRPRRVSATLRALRDVILA